VRYRIELPPGMRLVTANERGDLRARATLIRDIRVTAHLNAHQQEIPAMTKALVRGIFHYPDNRARDPANWSPSLKAMIDGGLVDTGIIPDDNDRHLIHWGYSRGRPDVPGGQLVLVVKAVGWHYEDQG
jgi:crossover junction endodeoxyribonuclease RusA